ncbi:TetR family transcriptional regulator [Tessaracoccus sp. MC1627]|uniref:TetR/AcrR family transcriptional regulator n=1 Tax=Tessaracoccus sp. MC1627 TaxID=2760312 RepID=UPI0016016EEC|nr:TetR family transcriptional regulator [Tessaracoccus sp. MC1627]
MPTSPTAAQGRAPHRRPDPGRRDRIIQSCLDVIAERGVAGTSHRAVAAAAGVPLGSMTYHFTGIDELLHEAFASFTRTVIDRFKHRMGAATSIDEARQAVFDLITADLLASQRELVLTHELYTLAARDPSYRALTNAWMRSSRAALEQHFDPATARLLDALIEGLTIHRALDTEPQDPALARTAIARVTGS